MRIALQLLGTLIAVSFAFSASAEESVYTPLELENCKLTIANPGAPEQFGVWLCPGHGGVPVWVAEGDLRFFVSYGGNAEFERAASETLPPFNTIHTTLEWRIDDLGTPFATILRYFTDYGDGTPPEQVLVVTRLGADGVCHVAYVNASTNDNANSLARQAADLIARNFRCEYHLPLVVGEPGRL